MVAQKDPNKAKKDQLDKLQDPKDPKITTVHPGLKDLRVKLQDLKGLIIKLQGHKDPQRGLQEAKTVEIKEVKKEVKLVKEGLKAKLQGHKGQLKGPKDLKLKVPPQDHNKSPKDLRDPSNSLVQLTGKVDQVELVPVEPWKCVLMFVLHFLLVYSEPVWPDVRNGVLQRNKNGLI